MAHAITSLAPKALAQFDTVIDVRSPSEFAEDHLPGAINLPVMSDAERARVGTIYVQDSAFKARKIGAAIVARNAARHIETELAGKEGGWRPLVYCWRGGQRSGSFASILSQIGWRTDVLDGGYRSYRRLVVKALYEERVPHTLVLLDGNTGSGKTVVLKALAARGVQVLDLEGMAAHKGSLLGGLSGPQPSQKMFESRLAQQLCSFDPARPVLLEAESSKIGERLIPTALWKAMRAAPRIEIAAPLAARAEFLTRDYAQALENPAALAEGLDRLRPYCGHERVASWRALLGAGAHRQLASELMQHHYDPSYTRSRKARAQSVLAQLVADDLSDAAIARFAGDIIALLDQG